MRSGARSTNEEVGLESLVITDVRQGDGNPPSRELRSEPNTVAVRIEGLEPGLNYFFRVPPVQRNKRVQLQELTDLVATRKQGAQEQTSGASNLAAESAPDVPSSQFNAFERAGWVFQERRPDEDGSASTSHAKVFVKSGGWLALSTNILTVKFKDDLTDEEANARLASYGCRVLDRLTFAPGLFRVALTPQARGDVLDVANELSDSGLVEFTEPEIIEVTGPRSP